MTRLIPFLAVAVLSTATLAPAADSPFESLPPQTVFSLSIPAGAKAWGEFAKSRFAQVMLSQERVAGLFEIIAENADDDFSEFQEKAAEAGVSEEDWYALIGQDAGFAVTLYPNAQGDNSQKPQIGLHIWATASQDLVDKLLTLPDAKRQDVQAGDLAVSQFVAPNGTTVVLHRAAGDRLLITVGAEGRSTEQVQADLLAWAGGDHRGASDGPSVLAAGKGSPEAPGDGVLKLGFFPRALFAVMPMDEVINPMGGTTLGQALDAAGVTWASALAMDFSIEGNLLHGAFSARVPGPRQGLMRLIEQPELPATVASFTPADTLGYQHFSFDLLEAKNIILEFATVVGGPMAAQQYAQAEAMAPGFLGGMTLDQIFGAFGQRIVGLDFGEAQGGDPEAPTTRAAVVWDLADSTVLNNLLNVVKALAGNQPNLAFVTEQGANGVRLDLGPMMSLDLGVFVATKQLVIAFGDGVASKVLSAINSPAATFATSEVVTEAKRLLPPKAGWSWQVQDGEATVSRAIGALKAQLSQLAMMQGDETLSALADLLPSNTEAEDLLGVGSGHLWVDEHGLHGESVATLPSGE